jgi:phytoene dehydrogenase-like protein
MTSPTAPAGGAWDAVVVGGGHNGLVTAAYLARAGLGTLVLERREVVGGAVETSEIAPGFRAPTVAHTVGRLRPSVVRDLRLREHGLSLLAPDVRAFAPQLDGTGVTLWSDDRRTVEGLRSRSARDADAYPAFDRLVRSLGRFLGEIAATTPPDIRSPSLGDALAGLRLGRSFRGLGKHDARTALRVLPMAVADFVAEAFESDPLRALIASRGIQYTGMGPWSAGTTAVLLADSAGNDGGAAGQTVFAKGGPGAVSDALVASLGAFGGHIRTGADVAAITSVEGRANGVVLATGEEIGARCVVSGLDPKTTLTRLLDPVEIGPTLGWRASNYRTSGSTAKVNIALSGLPVFPAAGDDARQLLRGRIVLGPGIDDLERAFDDSKYGRMSAQPYVEATIPSLVDPLLTARAPVGSHVMSAIVQWMPYRLRDYQWDDCREALGDLVIRRLEQVAPGFGSLVVGRQVLTPLDLEREYGLAGGHPLHGEPSLDQFFLWRPLLGHARYRMPVDRLYLCGSGAHPGGGVTGQPGQNAAREILSDWKKHRRQ